MLSSVHKLSIWLINHLAGSINVIYVHVCVHTEAAAAEASKAASGDVAGPMPIATNGVASAARAAEQLRNKRREEARKLYSVLSR